jgi:hypothetical protein
MIIIHHIENAFESEIYNENGKWKLFAFNNIVVIWFTVLPSLLKREGSQRGEFVLPGYNNY